MEPSIVSPQLHELVVRELLRIAQEEDRRASEEAAGIGYWQPYPEAAVAHRAAASALRADAARLSGAA